MPDAGVGIESGYQCEASDISSGKGGSVAAVRAVSPARNPRPLERLAGLAAGLAVLGLAALGLQAVWLATPAWALPVDLELVLAVDVSQSVDSFEAAQQRGGYLDALTHPAVISAIESGGYGRIAVTYVEWAGETYQKTVVDWSLIDGADSAYAFAAALAGQPVTSAPYTSISAVIDFARRRFEDNGYEGHRRVIDISGDGPSSVGRPVERARDDAVAAGITINGLPVFNDRPNPGGAGIAANLDFYYEQKVIGGPAAFIMVAQFDVFAPTVLRKLVREIAAGGVPALARSRP